MFEFSTKFKRISGNLLTLNLTQESNPGDGESLPFYYFDIY